MRSDMLRIVVADDWPERRTDTRRTLETAGFLVVADVGSMRGCYEAAMTTPVDAVLSSPLLTSRQGQELLALFAPVTPLFRPALVSLRAEYPELVVSYEYQSAAKTVVVPDRASVAAILREVADLRKSSQKWRVKDRDVDCFLKALGFAREISGYATARYALTSLPDGFMAKELYADMANHFRTSPENVDRTLRFAVKKAVKTAGEGMWTRLAGSERSNLKVLAAMRAALREFEER